MNKENLSCPSCGSLKVIEEWKKDDFEYGENSIKLSVEIPICHCNDCNLDFTDWRSEELREKEVNKYLQLNK